LIRPTPPTTLFPYTTLFRSYCSHCFHRERADNIDTRSSRRKDDGILRAKSCDFEIGSGGWSFGSHSGPSNHRSRIESFDQSQGRSEEHTSELQSRSDLVCRL